MQWRGWMRKYEEGGSISFRGQCFQVNLGCGPWQAILGPELTYSLKICGFPAEKGKWQMALGLRS